jgi:hypothetical protein
MDAFGVLVFYFLSEAQLKKILMTNPKGVQDLFQS